MNIFNKNNSKSIKFTSAILILFGLIFVFAPVIVMELIDYIVSAIFILIGIKNLVFYFLSKDSGSNSQGLFIGIFLIILSLYFVFNTGVILQGIALIFGIFMLLIGAFGFRFSLTLKNQIRKWKTISVFSIINIVLGLTLLINPFSTTKVLIIYVGIFMIISSILNLFSVFINENKAK